MSRFSMTADDLRKTFALTGTLFAASFVLVCVAAVVWRATGATNYPRTIGASSAVAVVALGAAWVRAETIRRMGLRGVLLFYGSAGVIVTMSLQLVFDSIVGARRTDTGNYAYFAMGLALGIISAIAAFLMSRINIKTTGREEMQGANEAEES